MTEQALAAARVAAVIVNYRTPALALDALASLAPERARLPQLRAVVVDGGSGDDSAEVIGRGVADERFAGWASALPLPINGGFGWANNQAMLRLLQAPEPPDFICLLNPDAQIEAGALACLVETMLEEPRAAAVGSRLIEADGAIAGSAFRFHSARTELARGARTRLVERLFGAQPVTIEADERIAVDWVTGASVLFRTSALREVGLFDTGFFLYFEETELMWRMHKAGWRVLHEPASRVRHLEGASTGLNNPGEGRTTAPRLPRYWFESRRRLLTLHRGRTGALAANATWLAGNLLFQARRSLRLARNGRPAAREGRDLIATGLWPKRPDAVTAITRADEPLDQPPAWMRHRAKD